MRAKRTYVCNGRERPNRPVVADAYFEYEAIGKAAAERQYVAHLRAIGLFPRVHYLSIHIAF